MKAAATALLVLAAALPAGPLRAQGQAHPILGKWRWTRPINACTEVYLFRSDGTLLVTSGTKKLDYAYAIAREPGPEGFFAMDLEVLQDHGGTDCSQTSADDTGKRYVSHILFEPSHGMYLSCSDPRLEACFGPLVRVRE